MLLLACLGGRHCSAGGAAGLFAGGTHSEGTSGERHRPAVVVALGWLIVIDSRVSN